MQHQHGFFAAFDQLALENEWTAVTAPKTRLVECHQASLCFRRQQQSKHMHHIA